MGLVVQAPADALATMLSNAADTPPAGAGVAGTGGFAAALQALISDGGGAKGGKADALLALLPKAPGDSDADGSLSGADTLAAALAALQALIAPAQAVAAPGTTEPGTGPSSAAAIPPSAATSLPADAIARTEAGADDAPAAETPSTAPPTEAGDLNAADALAEAQALLAGQPGGARPTGAPPAEHKTEALSGAPPPGAEPTPQPATSVVRFAGNAQDTDADTDSGGKPGDGAKPRAIAPIDSASPLAADVRVGQAPTVANAPAPATTATPPPAAPDLPPAVPQVAQSVLDQVQKGSGEARIHLHPAELGDIIVRVRTDGDHVRLEIHADRADAMNLLRDHTADLSNLLGSRGLNLGDVYVGLGADGGASANQGGDQPAPGNRPTPNGEFASLMGLGDSQPIEINNRLRAAYNPDGAHSYRI